VCFKMLRFHDPAEPSSWDPNSGVWWAVDSAGGKEDGLTDLLLGFLLVGHGDGIPNERGCSREGRDRGLWCFERCREQR
jgi:hypothetical protein